MNVKDLMEIQTMLKKYHRDLELKIEGFKPNSISEARIKQIKDDWKEDVSKIEYLIKAIENKSV